MTRVSDSKRTNFCNSLSKYQKAIKTMWNTSLPTCPGPGRYGKLQTTFFTTACIYNSKNSNKFYGNHLRRRCCFFWVVNAGRNEKSCLQFLIPTAVFHMLLSLFLPNTVNVLVLERVAILARLYAFSEKIKKVVDVFGKKILQHSRR